MARLARENAATLTDALTFRLAVETGAAEALARSPAQLADGREVLLARLDAVNSASPADYRRLDTLFHLSIAELTGSPLLTAACVDARMRLNDLLNAIPVLRRNIDNTARQHTAIATAILAGDANGAPGGGRAPRRDGGAAARLPGGAGRVTGHETNFKHEWRWRLRARHTTDNRPKRGGPTLLLHTCQLTDLKRRPSRGSAHDVHHRRPR